MKARFELFAVVGGHAFAGIMFAALLWFPRPYADAALIGLAALCLVGVAFGIREVRQKSAKL